MKKLISICLIIIGICLIISSLSFFGCYDTPQAHSDSGVKKATVKIKTDVSGHTVEQQNIIDRVSQDNQPGSIKHLYIISPYSGQVILYSTVRGKVTSGGKRLTPKTVTNSPYTSEWSGMGVTINDQKYRTEEVLQDDGTYGDSGDYLFWFSSNGRYHQHYLTGGQIIHVSSEPVAVKSVIINTEAQ